MSPSEEQRHSGRIGRAYIVNESQNTTYLNREGVGWDKIGRINSEHNKREGGMPDAHGTGPGALAQPMNRQAKAEICS